VVDTVRRALGERAATRANARGKIHR
jgi:hypothetical protein